MRREPSRLPLPRHSLLALFSGLLGMALLVSGCGQTSLSASAFAHLTRAEVQGIDRLQDPYLDDVQAMELPLRRLDLALGSSNPAHLAGLARPTQVRLSRVAQQLRGLARQAPQFLAADLRKESGALGAEASAITAIAASRDREQGTRALAAYRSASAATQRITATTQQALEIVGQG